MWRSLVVLVSLVLVLSAAQAPPFPCTFTDPVSGNLYDLSGAWRDPTSQSDYSFQNSLYTYNVNVCGNAASCPPDAGACQIEADRDIERSIGQAENATWAPLGTPLLVLTEPCFALDYDPYHHPSGSRCYLYIQQRPTEPRASPSRTTVVRTTFASPLAAHLARPSSTLRATRR